MEKTLKKISPLTRILQKVEFKNDTFLLTEDMEIIQVKQITRSTVKVTREAA